MKWLSLKYIMCEAYPVIPSVSDRYVIIDINYIKDTILIVKYYNNYRKGRVLMQFIDKNSESLMNLLLCILRCLDIISR